jgi:23S rRNA (cytosine1962-C5)-methyltransferase
VVSLLPGKGEIIRGRRHPWVYSGAVAEASEEARAGELVPLRDAGGEVIAWGFYSRNSRIAMRLVCFGPEPPPGNWLEERLAAALRLRRGLGPDSDAFRLVNAEGDGLPGLVVDVYNRTVVLRPLIRGMELRLAELQSAFRALFPGSAVFLKRDERAARVEELSLATGYLEGAGDGRETIREGSLRFRVDLERGQKTGFYLDQRDNRLLAGRLAAGRRVLNLFAYTGAFALHAAAGGAAEVVSVESSRGALALARESATLNPGLDGRRLQWLEADALVHLEKEQGSFDLVVLDPPPFARRKSELPGALRGYGQINRRAMERTAAEGLLLTFSCSGAVSGEQFSGVIAEAARRAGRTVQLLQALQAAPDHPVALEHPEGEYLKGWLLRVL